jgi:hypothetical protein
MPRQSIPPDKVAQGDIRATKIISLIGDLADEKNVEDHSDVLWAAAQAHFRLRHFSQAEQYASRYFALNPREAEEFGGPVMQLMHKAAQNQLNVHVSANDTERKSSQSPIIPIRDKGGN